MIKKISLKHIRCHKALNLKLSPKTTVIIGPNGSGKTSVVEAVCFLSTGRSFKNINKTIVSRGQKKAKITITESGKRYSLGLDLEGGRLRKTKQINSQTKTFTYKHIPTVLFEPDQLAMFHGGPDKRRGWIDQALTNTSTEYKKALNEYRRILQQRNAGLKQNTNKSVLFAINLKLSETADTVNRLRTNYLKEINPCLQDMVQQISQKHTTVSAAIKQSIPLTKNYPESLLKKLEENLEQERALGFTLVGPHRDDIVLKQKGKEVSGFASRGETRTIALGLKLAEAEAVATKLGKKPILLLDDALSELDEYRQTKLIKILHRYQTIITATDAEKSLGEVLKL